MKRFSPLAVAAIAALAIAPVGATQNYYETFENFAAGGPGSTTWGTDALGTTWGHPFGGNADLGFFDVAGYPDDAASAVQFSSLQSDPMQNTQLTQNSIGGATAPYALSFALKLDDNAGSNASYIQLLAANSFVTGPGFRTAYQVQIWGPNFGPTQSCLAITQFNPSTGASLSAMTGVLDILAGANSFDATGAGWNVVILVVDPANTTLRAWVNPTSPTALPDIENTGASIGTPVAPHFLSIGAYTFASDPNPATERIATIDSVKITSGAASLNALFAEVYAGYSTLASASVGDWTAY